MAKAATYAGRALSENTRRAYQSERMLSDRSCPFDLHRLLPVPDAVLRLGPDNPASQA